MNSMENELAAQTVCTDIGGSEDEKVCKFIVRNLLEIEKIRKKDCVRRGKIEGRMKGYIQCTMLNLWSAMYRSHHCNKKNVVDSAYNKVKSTIQGPSSAVGCGECKFEQLEPMRVVGEFDMLIIILALLNADSQVMKLIREKQELQAGGNCNDEEEVLTKLRLPGHSGTDPREGRSAVGDNVLRDLVNKWTERNSGAMHGQLNVIMKKIYTA